VCTRVAPQGLRVMIRSVCMLLLQAESKLVFVPSTSDAGPAAILPRPPLPEPLIADAKELLPNAVFASNPCRIRFYNQVSARLCTWPQSLRSMIQPWCCCELRISI